MSRRAHDYVFSFNLLHLSCVLLLSGLLVPTRELAERTARAQPTFKDWDRRRSFITIADCAFTCWAITKLSCCTNTGVMR